jgi:hypothetical protein
MTESQHWNPCVRFWSGKRIRPVVASHADVVFRSGFDSKSGRARGSKSDSQAGGEQLAEAAREGKD